MKTIIEIAVRLNSIELLHKPIFREYFDSIISTDTSVHGMLYQINFLEQQLQFVMQVFGSGIMSLNEHGNIIFVNEPAAGLIGRPPQHLFKKHLSMVLPGIWEDASMTAVKDKVITVNSNVIIVSVHTIEYTSVQHGYIVLLKNSLIWNRSSIRYAGRLCPKAMPLNTPLTISSATAW